MGRILNLFARRLEGQDVEYDDGGDKRASLTAAISGSEATMFESMGESQQSIDGALASTINRLQGLQTIIDGLTAVRAEVSGTLDDHRKIALTALSIEHDRNRFEQMHAEKADEADRLTGELGKLRIALDESRASYAKAASELELLEQRHHLLAVAKKESEEQAARQAAVLLTSQDEAEALRLEVVSLREQTSVDDGRLAELSQSNQERFAQISLLTTRCENFEHIVQQRGDEIAILNEQVNKLHRANEAQMKENQLQERENAALRIELSKAFERHQADLRSRDGELNSLRSEHDLAQSSIKVLEQFNTDLKLEQEKQFAEIRRLQDDAKQLEIAAARADGKALRLGISLDAAQSAKTQLDQSRTTMMARVETMSQSLRSAEADTRRLENEVARLTALLEQNGAQSRDTIDVLNGRISTLEKDLVTQSKEAVFYSAQIEQMKKAL